MQFMLIYFRTHWQTYLFLYLFIILLHLLFHLFYLIYFLFLCACGVHRHPQHVGPVTGVVLRSVNTTFLRHYSLSATHCRPPLVLTFLQLPSPSPPHRTTYHQHHLFPFQSPFDFIFLSFITSPHNISA